MIHFLPDPEQAAAVPPSAATLRTGGLVRALAVLEELGGEQPGLTAALAGRLAVPGEAPLLDQLSERAVAAAAAGLEAISVLAEAGAGANPAAARLLADTIRDALDEMGAVISL